ncbi:fimbria/pilus periplasmic chaperone [Pseudomonas sp. NFXW11]|uniref:fimbria/pilus periplasmic chaperone n=1 Tax=Pseudomonas sp. NFXW11 TaxID=2819531 RepID=UPI003CF2C22F
MNRRFTPRSARLYALLLVFLSLGARADLTVVGTRFIYPAGLPALSIRVGNQGLAPLLLQAWLDRGDASVDPSALQVPFILSPPLSRLDPQQRATLSVRYSGEPLPADRESLFWLNLLEVPSLQAVSGNQLRMSYRLRMKLLYRPEGLAGHADEAVRQLCWQLHGAGQTAGELQLKASNPTPYHVSLAQLHVLGGGAEVRLEGITLEPLGSTLIALPGLRSLAASTAQVHYQVATDSGEMLSGSAAIQP